MELRIAKTDSTRKESHARISYELTQNLENMRYMERASFWVKYWMTAKFERDHAGTLLARMRLRELVEENYTKLPLIWDMYFEALRSARSKIQDERIESIKVNHHMTLDSIEVSQALTQRYSIVSYKERMTHWLYRLGMAIRQGNPMLEKLAFKQIESLAEDNDYLLQAIYNLNNDALINIKARQEQLDRANQGDGKCVLIGSVTREV